MNVMTSLTPKQSFNYLGFVFEVVYAREATRAELFGPAIEDTEDWDEILIDTCGKEEAEGFTIEVMFREPSGEVAYTSYCYPEDEVLFKTAEEAINYIKDGFAYEDFKRSMYDRDYHVPYTPGLVTLFKTVDAYSQRHFRIDALELLAGGDEYRAWDRVKWAWCANPEVTAREIADLYAEKLGLWRMN